MLGWIECLLAISATAVACMYAGRVAALTLTAVAAATAAVIMPPFSSWQVDSTADLLALLFQTVVGVAVVYAWPSRMGRQRRAVPFEPVGLKKTGDSEACFLSTIARDIVQRETGMADRVSDIDVHGELDPRTAISRHELDRILSDIIRIAFSDPKVQRVHIYTSRQPSLDQISVTGQYCRPPAQPHFHLIGRSDRERPIQTRNWPDNCSATYIDNGFEHTYHVSIYKNSSAVR